MRSGMRARLQSSLRWLDPENLPRYCAEAFIYLRELVKDVTGEFPDQTRRPNRHPDD